MGNTACCEGPIKQQGNMEVIIPVVHDHQLKDQNAQNNTNSEISLIPELSQAVKQNLKKHRPFQDKLTGQLKIKKFESLVYQGQTNSSEQPHGYGRMYYPNGSVYVGSFENGKANGQAHFVFSDGSYYAGTMKNNKAEDNSGIFEAEGLKYSGSIKNNQMDGFGKQEGENYRYEGHFQNGKRKLGKLDWTQKQTKKLPMSQEQLYQIADWSYQGNFNEQGDFHGKGILKGPKGKYTGEFKNGLKHGTGTFQYINKLKYEGAYQNDIRHGEGTLYSTDERVAYSGSFEKGLPHGRGWIPLPDGTKNYLLFNQGISCLLSEKQ